MEKSNHEKETLLCPVGRFFAELETTAGRKSAFHEHMNKARVEFLKAVRSLVDERIERMETKPEGGERKATRVEVE